MNPIDPFAALRLAGSSPLSPAPAASDPRARSHGTHHAG
jgi:hypothetical protein